MADMNRCQLDAPQRRSSRTLLFFDDFRRLDDRCVGAFDRERTVYGGGGVNVPCSGGTSFLPNNSRSGLVG